MPAVIGKSTSRIYQNVGVKWLALFHILEVPASNLGSDIVLAVVLRGFIQSVQANDGIVP
jgi:hypothetical protein